ncbi:HNH endonuclease [Clostridium sp.]|uniref:HNH endonuclease n=1 Tax=Clostridium sp. TaxID=1506 RepID=UPI003D6CD0D2
MGERAYATFKRMYGNKIKNHHVPLEKLINNQNRHNRYKTKTFAVKVQNNYIGITKAFITHSNWERCPFNSKMTPYTEEGRELYIKRNGKTKKLPLNRPNILDAVESTMTANRQIYNFEYFMNRAYAYNRDKGNCRVCNKPLKEHESHCHHIRNSLFINEINKVPNLAYTCVTCHEYIHGMTIPIKTTKEIKIKIKAYKEKLKVVRA